MLGSFSFSSQQQPEKWCHSRSGLFFIHQLTSSRNSRTDKLPVVFPCQHYISSSWQSKLRPMVFVCLLACFCADVGPLSMPHHGATSRLSAKHLFPLLSLLPGCSLDDNGVEFPIGQIWSPGDPCELCVCQVNDNLLAFSCFTGLSCLPPLEAGPLAVWPQSPLLGRVGTHLFCFQWVTENRRAWRLP